MKLSDGERERLYTLIHVGKHPARQLMKARILLKASGAQSQGNVVDPATGVFHLISTEQPACGSMPKLVRWAPA